MSNKLYQDCALAATDIVKKYGAVTVLHKMKFFLKTGEIHALLGANGAGKSTMLKIIDGLITDYQGQLYIDGNPVRFASPMDAQKKGIGMVHQELSVLPNISVAENVFLNRLPRNKAGFVDWKKLYSDTKEILMSIGLDIDPKLLLDNLSVADMQMVEIARILSMNVPILLLDEPTSALSEAEIRRLLDVMKKLREAGKSIVFITHKLDEILEVSDRVTVMRDGHFVDTIEVKDRSEKGQGVLVGMMIGADESESFEMYPQKGTEFGDTVLEVKNLGRAKYFKEINFTVREKEVVVLTGLKGAKRTEVARCVFGADPFTSGEVCFKGQSMGKTSVGKSIKHHMALLTEDRKNEGLALGMSVRHNVSLSTIEDCASFGFISGKKLTEKADKYVEILGIKVPSINQPVTSLSGGNQQKVVLAKWLAAAPEFLILDEPTRGIDIGAKREIYHFIRKLANQGTAILVISSEIPEVIGLADRVYVMNEGEMVGELNTHPIQSDVIMHMMFKQTVTGVEKA